MLLEAGKQLALGNVHCSPGPSQILTGNPTAMPRYLLFCTYQSSGAGC